MNFLTHVLDQEPSEILDEFDNRPLVDLWVERYTNPSQQDIVKAYLVYQNVQSSKTWTVWAVHNGSSSFGDLTVE